jgi:hypothetical protein
MQNGGPYAISDSGRRLVHGDVCAGVDKLIPDTDGRGNCNNCSHRRAGGGGHHLLWVLTLLGVFGGAFAWWRFMASDSQKLAVLDLMDQAASFVASLVEWAKDKVLPGRRYQGMAMDNEELNYFQPLGDAGDTQQPGRFTL